MLEKISKYRNAGSNRVVYLEFMRIVACFLVIVNHTEESLFLDREPSATWFVGVVYLFVCKIAVPLFLMISGALLLSKADTPQKSIKRICRAGLTFVAASAVYYIYYGMQSGETLNILDFCTKVIQKQMTNAFWYFYLYLGILCLLPILQKMVKAMNKRECEWLIFLSVGVLGTVSLIHLFVPAFGLSWYFTSVLFSTYIGMLVCGYYIEQYVEISREKAGIAANIFVLLIWLQTIATLYFYQKDSGSYLQLDNRNLITITGATICFYVVVKYLFEKLYISSKIKTIICYLGELTFGIYLLSDLAIDLTRPIHQILCSHMHVVLAMGIWEVFIFAICAAVVAGMNMVLHIHSHALHENETT